MLVFFGEEFSIPHPTSKLENHPLSTVHNCFLNTFTATLHFWRPSPPSTTQGHAMPFHGDREPLNIAIYEYQNHKMKMTVLTPMYPGALPFPGTPPAVHCFPSTIFLMAIHCWWLIFCNITVMTFHMAIRDNFH